ncbi:ribosomal protein S5 domain 2-type protein [Dichotomocladium elegans]|nr:ribosomal protein S5 domain 2-type protein [Dichotomocladium elegans]
MEQNKELQDEEIMALEAIYGSESIKKDSSTSHGYHFTINLDSDDDDCRSPRILGLRLFLPDTYPTEDPPVYEISSVYCGTHKVDATMLETIDREFAQLFQPGQVVLFEWITWLRDYLEATVEKRELASVFIAHVAKVHSAAEVKAVISKLLENKKIARATHNISAYRIELSDGRILQDNDDDGETAAGGKYRMNVVVVVSRWFGGILLGADRFKDINNCARKALEECGYIHDPEIPHKTKRKK